MKTLLVVIGVLILATGLFFLVGKISPGQESVTEITVNATVEHSWEIYHDEELMSEWIPSVKKIDLVSGQKNTVGAQYEITMEDRNGNDTKMHESLTKFNPPKSYAMDYSNDMLTGTMEVDFEDMGNAVTVIKTTNNFKGKSTILRSMFHFFNFMIEGETKKQGEALKELIEESYIEKQQNQSVSTPEHPALIPQQTTTIDTSAGIN